MQTVRSTGDPVPDRLGRRKCRYGDVGKVSTADGPVRLRSASIRGTEGRSASALARYVHRVLTCRGDTPALDL